VDYLVSRLLAGAALAGALAGASPAFAQGAPVVSRPVVQALPGADSKRLSAALSRLGRDPRDLASLIEAGDAARGMQDFAAAIGFYRRAQEVSPGNARASAGLGSAFVMTGDPVSAIPEFDAADKAGVAPASIAADRGLAYDLVGDTVSAQRYYALALPVASGAAADELRNRLAISQAIDGHDDAAYLTLLPLLNKQDKPGWRTHAFTLAIAGKTNDAVQVADKILPTQLAANIAPYLRYMPRLTKAQQAAAANLGRFPRASEIGRDDARIAAYAPPRANAAGGGLIPKGQPFGAGLASRSAKPSKAQAARLARAEAEQQARQAQVAKSARATQIAAADPDRVAPPEPRPTIERESGELPPLAGAAGVASTVRSSTPPAAAPSAALAAKPALTLPPVAEPARTPTPAPTPALAAASTGTSRTATPGFDLGRMATSRPTAVEQAPARAPTPTPPATQPLAPTPAAAPTPGAGQLSLSEIFADLGKPTAEPAPVAGAVDIRLITPAAPPPRVQPPKVEDVEAEQAETKLAPAKGREAKPVPKTAREIREAKAAELKAKGAKAPAASDEEVDDAAAAKDAKPKSAKAKAAELKAKGAKATAAADEEVDDTAATKDTKPKSAKAKAAEAKAEAAKKAELAKAKKPLPPAHPSRIWVQIGVGRNKAAIAFDWRRDLRESPALFKGREPYVSDMGRTNRILIGPFATQKAATAFLADAKKQGFADALPWTSPAGQVVDPLGGK
jgi:hypothetical protein